MKKITKHPLFIMLLLFPLWGLGGCSKDDNAPPITQENSFSCKINGELFVPEDHGGFPNSFEGIIITVYGSDWTFILGNGENTVFLYLHNVTQVGEYVVSESDGDGDFVGAETNLVEVDLTSGTSNITHKSTDNSGIINVIELDLDNRIILTFDEITLISNENPSETITLTEGKLNINLETLNQ